MIGWDEGKIRNRAYLLWERAGWPQGRDQEFWRRAEEELAREDQLDLSKEDTEMKKTASAAGASSTVVLGERGGLGSYSMKST